MGEFYLNPDQCSTSAFVSRGACAVRNPDVLQPSAAATVFEGILTKMQLHFSKDALPDCVSSDFHNLNKLSEQVNTSVCLFRLRHKLQFSFLSSFCSEKRLISFADVKTQIKTLLSGLCGVLWCSVFICRLILLSVDSRAVSSGGRGHIPRGQSLIIPS